MSTTKDKEWNDWTQKFLDTGKASAACRAMDKDESNAFITLMFAEEGPGSAENMKAGLSKDFLFQVMTKRADFYKLDATVPVMAFVRFLCTSPADTVMWVHAMKKMQLIANGERVEFDTLTHYFPLGFPTTDTLHKLWEEQKGMGGAVDNYLDTVIP